MVIGFLVVAFVAGLSSAIAILTLGYGWLMAFVCYTVFGAVTFLLMVFFYQRNFLIKLLPRHLGTNFKSKRS